VGEAPSLITTMSMLMVSKYFVLSISTGQHQMVIPQGGTGGRWYESEKRASAALETAVLLL